MHTIPGTLRRSQIALLAICLTATPAVILAGTSDAPASHSGIPTIWVWDWSKTPGWKQVTQVVGMELANRATASMNQEGNRVGRVYALTDGTIPTNPPRKIVVRHSTSKSPSLTEPRKSKSKKKSIESDPLLPLKVEPRAAASVALAGNDSAVEQTAKSESATLPANTLTGTAHLSMVSEARYHVGKVAQGTEARHVFRVRNMGSTPLQIQFESRSCDCTRVQVDDQLVSPRDDHAAGNSAGSKLIPQPATSAPASPIVIIAPKSVGRIQISVATESRSGLIEQEVTLRTNDPDRTLLKLQLAAEVVPSVDVERSDLSFGRVTAGQSSTVEFTVASALVDTLKIDEKEVSNPDLTVQTRPLTAEELRTAGKKQGYLVTVKLSNQAAVGPLVGEVSLFTNVPGYEEIKCHVHGEIAATGLWMSSPRFDLGNVRTGSEPIAGMHVKLTSTKPIQVRVSQAPSPGVKITAVSMPHPDHKSQVIVLEASVTSDAQAGQIDAFCELETDLPGARRIRIPVSGWIQSSDNTSQPAVIVAAGK